jgi:hypothetical protein
MNSETHIVQLDSEVEMVSRQYKCHLHHVRPGQQSSPRFVVRLQLFKLSFSV